MSWVTAYDLLSALVLMTQSLHQSARVKFAFILTSLCLDPVSLPSGGLEKTTRSSPHHVAQHRPTGSETTPPYASRSSRFGSEPPSVEDDVDVWRYAILRPVYSDTTQLDVELSTRSQREQLSPINECSDPVDSVCRS